MEFNLNIVDPILLETTLSRYPFLKNISVIFLISADSINLFLFYMFL